MGKTCCFSGYRPKKLPYLAQPEGENYQSLCCCLQSAIDDAVAAGYDTFISGFAEGVDLLAAEIVLKREGMLTLIAAIPWMGQSESWTPAMKTRYFDLLDRCDDVVYLADSYSARCFQQRNEYMVDRSQRLIAVYDGQKGGTANTVKYAKKCGREVVLIDPVRFTVDEQFVESLF